MIEIKVKSAAQWRGFDKCHLGISLHNPNLEGERLLAIIEWINNQKFSECFIDLSDSLHRHNLMARHGLDEKEALMRATDEGTLWLDKNGAILDRLRIPYRLYRWNHWFSFEDVAIGMDAFQRAFLGNDEFRAAVYRDVYSLTSRSGVPLDTSRLSSSVRYLLEELAVLSFYFRDYPCAKIYPGREQYSFRMVREGLVPGVPKGLANGFYTQLWLHRPEHASVEAGRAAA